MDQLIQGSRVSWNFKQERGTWIPKELWIAQPAPEKCNVWDFTEEFRAQMQDYLNTIPKAEVPISGVGNKKREQAPVCPLNPEHGPMKKSKSGRTWQCVNARWSKESGELLNVGCQGKRDA